MLGMPPLGGIPTRMMVPGSVNRRTLFEVVARKPTWHSLALVRLLHRLLSSTTWPSRAEGAFMKLWLGRPQNLTEAAWFVGRTSQLGSRRSRGSWVLSGLFPIHEQSNAASDYRGDTMRQ
jgi:hypothetical protein